MSLYQVFDQGTEVRGSIATMFFNNINHDEIEPVVAQHNFNQIDPNHWYSFQGLLDVFNVLLTRENAPENFVAVGIAAGDERVAALPTDVLEGTFLDLLLRYSQSYPNNYRNGDPGHLTVEQIDENNYLVHVHTPYPDDVYYGVLYSIARHYCQYQGRTFTLRYADGMLQHDNGGEKTVYRVTVN
jgi:hypothetical protein